MRWTIGTVRISKVTESEFAVPLEYLLQGVPPNGAEPFGWLAPDFVNGQGEGLLSFHGFVIDTGSLRILVDTGIGDMRAGLPAPPMPSAFLAELVGQGYGLADIDFVVCTHLHFDHVGANTTLVDGKWQVTFPAAQYLFVAAEWEHWRTHETEFGNFAETVRPVLDAGAAALVQTNHVICDEVQLIPTPGHTPGHVSVSIESLGQRAVITGDLAHHPIQFALPDIGMAADVDASLATQTRRRFLADRVDDGALVLGSHFAGRTGGRVLSDGSGWRLDTSPR